MKPKQGRQKVVKRGINESHKMQNKQRGEDGIGEKLSKTISEDSDDNINSEIDCQTAEIVENKTISEDSNDSIDSEIDSQTEIVENKSDSEESESDDESDDESDSDASEDKEEDFDHQWQELGNEAPNTEEAFRRIAVCNMDWDRIRAVDLLVCFESFKPANGSINSVKIYPSEFGLQRIQEEKLNGPSELIEKTLPLDEEEVENKKEAKFQREKLRQYQISRLKYYYAVVDCDSAETASTLYEQLNGMEYESSAVRFDLRFIPDDMTFDQKPTSIADKKPDPLEYKPRHFVTTALQQIKVDLTWDETDPKRKEFFEKVFKDPDSVQNDIQDYLASASSDSEEEVDTADKESGKTLKTEDRLAKYRELLLSIEKEEQENEKSKYDIEITWEPALEKKTKEKVQEKIKKDSLNPFEEMLHKKKEDRKLKKREHKMTQEQAEDSDDSEEASSSNILDKDKKPENEKKLAELALISDSKKASSFEENAKKKKKKAKNQDLEGFVGDMNDPRFSAMYTSSLFNMIPSDQHPKKESNFHFKGQKERKFKTKNHEAKRARYH